MQNQVTILGGGESGVGAAILAARQGFEVLLSDAGPISDKYRSILEEREIFFEQGGHSPARILESDLVIKSPGIPDSVPLVQALLDKGIPVISEIEFASRYTNARLIAITGSNGKTTTTLLTYHLLKSAGLNVGLAGNVGDSFAWQVAEQQFDYYVLEVSSFQLDNIDQFRPFISILLNITPDHLDRYNYDFQQYIDSKFNIIRNQTTEDFLIYFDGSEVINKELKKRAIQPIPIAVSMEHQPEEGSYFEDNRLISRIDGRHFDLAFQELPIKGPHNAINALAAISAAMIVGINEDDIRAALKSFRNAPHRLEEVAVIDDVTYINDSKATNVDSVYYALGSFDKPVILIAGGVDKGNDYDQIRSLVQEKVKGLIILSKKIDKLRDYFSGIVSEIYPTQDVQDAVRKAKEWSKPGDIVLLSPACASFDLFKNYEDRGEQFKAAVQSLIVE